MKYLVTTPANTADKDVDAFKAKMAASLGVKAEDVILVPAGVTVNVLDVPGPSAAKTTKKKDKDGHAAADPAEITRLCKQLHEDEDEIRHAEDHEETTKLLTEIGEPAVPELRKWATTGNGPGNKRCADLADSLDKKKTKAEHDDKKEEKHLAKAGK